jgi:photosystem II stability/assembly factor-like uncharacterized protein
MKKLIILFIIHYFPIRMLTWISTAVVVSTLLINVAFSQSGWIVQSPLPTDKDLNSVKYLSKDTIIAIGGEFGYYKNQIILKSYNNGDTWMRKYANSTNCLYDLCFINSNTGFAVGDSNFIIKTTNAGENWFSINTFNSLGTNISVFFVNSDLGYIYNDSGKVLKTTNCGQNWTMYSHDGFRPAWPNKLFFVNENTGYLTKGNGYYQTTNGGVNWIFNQFGISGGYNAIYFVNELTGFVAGILGCIAKTTNGGINWIILPNSNGQDLSSIKFINENTGYSAGSFTILKTTNQGLNWSVYSINAGIRNLDIDSYGNGIGVCIVGKVVRTTNSGNNWEVTSSGTIYNLFTLSIINNNTGYSFGSYGEVLKTTNSGFNWNTSYCGTYYELIYSKFFDENTGIAASNYALVKTTNGGLNWTVKNSPNSIRCIHFPNSTVGFLLSSTKVFKTNDSGDNWTQTYEFSTYQEKLFFCNSNIGFTGGFSGEMKKTTDGGYNWITLYSGCNDEITSIYFMDSITGYVSYFLSYLISKTTNGGINWINIASNDMNYVKSFYFINNNTGYLSTDNPPYSIMKTTNGGNNWTKQLTGNYSLNAVSFVDSSVGYAAGSLGVILKTTNGGSVWVSNNSQEIPKSFELFQNYPNPFNPITNIKYQITNNLPRQVIIRVYDILGKEVATLVNEKQSPGIYEVTFNGNNFASGVYFYRIQVGNFMQVKKMVLIK